MTQNFLSTNNSIIDLKDIIESTTMLVVTPEFMIIEILL
jgi:hypothetical protein